jgi:hypothetical protein
MTIIQNLLSVRTSSVSNTIETGQELFEYTRTEIIPIPFVQIPTGVARNLNQTNLTSGLAYSNQLLTDSYISLPFSVRYNGIDWDSVRLTADSCLIFQSTGSYTHNSSPNFNISGSIPYNKIFINASTLNSFYGATGDLTTYGYNGCIRTDSGIYPDRTVKLTYTGFHSSKSSPLIWSITFYERQSASGPSYMDLHISQVHANTYDGFHDRSRLFKNFPLEASRGYRIITSQASNYNWTCPEGVYEVSAVCIGGGGGSAAGSSGSSGAGGGGLGWRNNISVTPGNTYTISVGSGGLRAFSDTGSISRAGTGGQSYFINSSTVAGNGGQGGQTNGDSAGTGGSYVGTGGGNGGSGGSRGGSSSDAGGGGGAGGYTGPGGNGGNIVSGNAQNGSAGSGGGGGGGGGCGSGDTAGCGGGVGVYGEGNSGNGGSYTLTDGDGGKGGSNGEDATSSSYDNSPYLPSRPGNYGGGGCGADVPSDATIEDGGSGAVRLIWGPRFSRQFPSTDTQDLYVTYRYIKWEISNARNSSSIQVSEFKFLYNHSEIIYKNNTSISSATGSNPNNLIDYITTSKFTDSTLTSIVTFDLQTQLNITGYKWTTADNDANQDPKSWILYGSNDGNNWEEIDRITNYTAPSNRQTSTRVFYLPIIPK